jgi:hypothetical protein
MCDWCDEYSHLKGVGMSTDIPPQWGLSKDMCVKRLWYSGKILKDTGYTFADDYKNDYAKLLSLTRDKATIDTCLQKLDGEITSKPGGFSPETNWLRLSSILSHFEKMCGFPEDVLLPMGILTSEIFYSYIRRGYILKDYGAGVKHGEFTHRLQWHVIMRVITNNFSKARSGSWDHSPFELYTSFGQKPNLRLWGFLFDKPGSGNDKEFFNHPDAFHARVLNEKAMFPKLAEFVARRETKRRQEFVANILKFLENKKIDTPDKFMHGSNPLASHDNFVGFEQWFMKTGVDKYGSDEFSAKYNSIKNKGESQYKKDKTRKLDTWGDKLKTALGMEPKPKPKHRNIRYLPAGDGPVYKLSRNALMSEDAAIARAKTSHDTLFAAV